MRAKKVFDPHYIIKNLQKLFLNLQCTVHQTFAQKQKSVDRIYPPKSFGSTVATSIIINIAKCYFMPKNKYMKSNIHKNKVLHTSQTYS